MALTLLQNSMTQLLGSSSNALNIDGSGNVGIGTTTPARVLTVYKAGATSRLLIQTDLSGQSIGNGFDLFLDQSGVAGVWNYQNAAMQFATNNLERMRIDSSGHLRPGSDNTYNLGSTSYRWANIYTADAHFSNEGSEGNSIDGTTGNWTLQEGENDIYMLNNKTGKKYRIKLEEV